MDFTDFNHTKFLYKKTILIFNFLWLLHHDKTIRATCLDIFEKKHLSNYFFFFLIAVTPYGSSWARDEIQAVAATSPQPDL